MMTRSAVRRSPRRSVVKKEGSQPTGASNTGAPGAKRHKSASASLASAAVGMGALAASDSCSAAAVAVVTPCPAFVGSSPGHAPRTSRYFASVSPSKLFSEPPDTTSTQQVKNIKTKLERTQSFQPYSSPDTPVHTLIIGTHPSIMSLSQNQYFGHTQNAFWWIAGDCLGFRRNAGVNAEGRPYKLTEYVRYDESKIIPYDEQLRILTDKGFALWDLVKECEREGSLDQNIKNEEPNDIRGFCSNHPSVKRIVLANGGTTCTMFNRFFKDWWLEGELRPGGNPESQKAFNKPTFAKQTDNFKNARIDVISALPVSPAAATYTYEQKRDSWEEHVYSVGLMDHEELMKGKK